jgi:hypothetical protein
VDGNVVKWVSDEITPPGIGPQILLPLTPVYVEPGWNLGLYFTSTGTVPFEYDGAPAYYTGGGSVLPVVGDILSYETPTNRIYSFVATGDAVLFSIEVVKTASPTAAAPSVEVTYTYTVTNTGEVPLSGVTVNDSNLLVSAIYDSGDTLPVDGILDTDETWIFIANYTIPVDAPEYLCNTATAEGWWYEEVNSVSDTSDEVCVHTMGARTIGYWKTHLEIWEEFDFMEFDQSQLLIYFPGSGAQANGVNPLEMLRAQLTAAALNVFYFNGDFDYSRYEDDLCGYGTIYEVIAEAEAFLGGLADDLNTFWSGMSKAEQREFRKEYADELALKDCLEAFNAMGDEIFE